MSFLEQSYLETESYLGDQVVQEMPAPDQSMIPAQQGMMLAADPETGLIQIPFTNLLITKQTALIIAAAAAVAAWYFFVYRKKE